MSELPDERKPEQKEEKKGPVLKVESGTESGIIQVAKWRLQKEGKSYPDTWYTIQKRYTSDGKNWKTATSYKKRDLMELYFLLHRILSQSHKGSGSVSEAIPAFQDVLK